MMRKYWRIIAIAAIIVVSVGTFYIQSTISANKLPQFSIEKISGDEKEIESLMLSGQYQEADSPAYEYMELGLDGTLYFRQQSFFKRLEDQHYPTLQLATLYKDHRDFMRGKGWSNTIFEDEQSIVHVDMIYRYDDGIDNKFIISILDKKTNKKTTFDHEIKTNDANGWIDILKIQVKDDQLKVITENGKYEEGKQKNEIYSYIFDLSKQTFINEEELFQLSNEQSGDDFVSTSMLGTTGAEEADQTIVFFRDIFTQIEDEEGFIVEDSVERTLIVYNLETEAYTEIDVDDMVDYGDPQFYDDEHIYFTDIDPEKGAIVHTYSLADKEVVNTLSIEQPEGSHGPHMEIEDGKLFLVNIYKDVKTPAYITVVDLKTEETLYQGEIVNKDIKEDFEFNIHTIGFK